MSHKANPRLIGGFVIGAVVLAVIIFIMFGSGKYFAKKYTYVVYFPSSVSGLSAGDPVKVKGITIGSIKDVEPLFSPAGEFFAEVFIEVDGQAIRHLSSTPEQKTDEEIMNDLFDRGLRAQLAVVSLITGKQYINLDLHPGTVALFMGFDSGYVEIPSIPTRSEELQGTLEGLIETVQNLDIAGLVESTKSLLARVDSLARLGDFRVTIDRLNEVLAATDTLVASLNAEVPQMSVNLRETSSAISQTAQRAEALFSRIDNVVTEEEMEFREAMNELEKAARAIRMLADELEQHPSSLIFGKDD